MNKTQRLPVATNSYFLTYSQCPLTPEFILNHLVINILKLIEFKVIRAVQEHHKNGDLHVHVIVLLVKELRLQSFNFFDILLSEKYHPNIVKMTYGIRSYESLNKYIKKEPTSKIEEVYGSNYNEAKIVDELVNSSFLCKSTLLDTSLKLIDIVGTNFHRIPVLMNAREIAVKQEIEELYRNPIGIIPSFQPLNITPIIDMSIKKRHIYLQGIPNSGKTTWLNQLASNYWGFFVEQSNDKFYQRYFNDAKILIVDAASDALLEFKNIEDWENGSQLNIKYASTQNDTRKPKTIIICSNYPPKYVFKLSKTCDQETWQTCFDVRFNYFKATQTYDEWMKGNNL